MKEITKKLALSIAITTALSTSVIASEESIYEMGSKSFSESTVGAQPLAGMHTVDGEDIAGKGLAVGTSGKGAAILVGYEGTIVTNVVYNNGSANYTSKVDMVTEEELASKVVSKDEFRVAQANQSVENSIHREMYASNLEHINANSKESRSMDADLQRQINSEVQSRVEGDNEVESRSIQRDQDIASKQKK